MVEKIDTTSLSHGIRLLLNKKWRRPSDQKLSSKHYEQQSTLQTSEISEDCYEVYALHDSGYMVKTYVEKGEETDQVQAVFDLLTIKQINYHLKRHL